MRKAQFAVHACVVALAGLMVDLAVCSGAEASSLVYFEEDGGTGSGQVRGLYDFDTTTGTSTLRAAMTGTDRFFAWTVRPSDGKVFAVASNNPGDDNKLYTVDINTGITTLVGALTINFPYITGLAFDPSGALYALENYSGTGSRLLKVDPATSAVTDLTDYAHGAPYGGRGDRGLVFSTSGTAYEFGGVTDTVGGYSYVDGRLYTVDPTNGRTTAVGGPGSDRPVHTEDAAFADGNLYSTDFGGTIYQVDPTTGISTVVGSTGMGNGLLGLFELPSLFPASPVPEPGTLPLIGMGMAAFMGLRRRH